MKDQGKANSEAARNSGCAQEYSDGQRPTSNVQHPTSKGRESRQAAYDLEERLLVYAVRVVRVVDCLPKSRGGDHLGGQLLRSGTSPALNHGEAQAAESRNDFIHKMKICLKELRESRRTLRIIAAVPLAKAGMGMEEVCALIGETEDLIRIFYAAIRTAESRRGDQNGGMSSRVREEVPTYNFPPSASIKDQVLEEADPITGAKTWTLDVERWTLDVDGRASSSVPSRSPISPEGTPQ